MGLNYTDNASWQQWQQSRRRLHVLKDRLRPAAVSVTERRQFWQRGEDPVLLVACDSNSPTNDHSLLRPLGRTHVPALVAAPARVSLDLPGDGWKQVDAAHLGSLRAVASIGDHLATGAWAHELARHHGWHQWVVQHGLLTPFAPPPPPGSTVLAWSSEDAAYLREGRDDLDTQVVGSPLLVEAARNPAPHVSRFETPVFLGQLHGAELSRLSMTLSTTAFWRATGAIYRPHPREEDKLSRLQHRVWQRMGMQIERAGNLAELNRPVVAAFSTGVLEAAARGVPAWVHHRHPPSWLTEVWRRYGLSQWGDPVPTAYVSEQVDPTGTIARLWEEQA